jgi:drug/metabolite transporter (DMT)-like permease
VSKRDDVENTLVVKREIKGKVTAVGDAVGGGSLDDAGPGFTDTARVGHTRDHDGAQVVRNRPDAQAYLHVALMVLFGSTTAPAAKYIVHSLPLSLIPVLRFGLACLCLVPLVAMKGGLGRLIRQDGWRLVLAAVLCVPLNQGFFLSATKLGLTSHVGLFYATCPLVVLLLAWGFGMERPDFARLTGVLVSVAGIVVIGIGHYLEHHSDGGAVAQSVVLSDLLLIGAVVSWGGYIAVSKPLVVRHGAMTVLAGTVLTGCLLSAPFALLELPSLSSLRHVPMSAWSALVFLGLVITPFAWAYQNLALRSFDASQVATFSNASPILTVVWGMWLFGEVLTPTLVAGGAMTLGGIYWACRPKRRGSRGEIVRREPVVRRSAESNERIPAMPGLVLAKEVVSR